MKNEMRNIKRNSSIIALFCIVVVLSACTKNPEGTITVTTKALSNITESSAKTGGTVTCSGYSIGDCGVCYGESHNPTCFTKDHTGTGSFNSTLSGLKSGTTYYVRAYAKTSSGIEYGNELSFTTQGGYTINVFANPKAGGTVTGSGIYQPGQSCTITATGNASYSFANWTEEGDVVSSDSDYTFSVTGNRNLIANFFVSSAPTGAIQGLFSVSADKQVWLSRGNLQYQASTDTWRFAEQQWHYVGSQKPDNSGNTGGNVVGSDNQYISETYNGWIDLFGWGTSGYHDEADPYNLYYQPWSTTRWMVNEVYNEWGYGPSTGMLALNLTGSSENYDWGVYNPISNGGNQAGCWRTMTSNEWTYLLTQRQASTVNGIANARFARAKVANVMGLIVFPDTYIHPSGVAQPLAINESSTPDWEQNNYYAADWLKMEAIGAAFLPAAGDRDQTTIYSPGVSGNYWSASYYSSAFSYYMYFSKRLLHAATTGTGRCCGLSVRLVCDAK